AAAPVLIIVHWRTWPAIGPWHVACISRRRVQMGRCAGSRGEPVERGRDRGTFQAAAVRREALTRGKGNFASTGAGAIASDKLMSTSHLPDRVSGATNLGGAPKKTRAPWKVSARIVSGSRPQVLLYGPRRGREAGQGEASEVRTCEEES